eukprot:8541765-Lingulodinium_polyedra.AAC.1
MASNIVVCACVSPCFCRFPLPGRTILIYRSLNIMPPSTLTPPQRRCASSCEQRKMSDNTCLGS